MELLNFLKRSSENFKLFFSRCHLRLILNLLVGSTSLSSIERLLCILGVGGIPWVLLVTTIRSHPLLCLISDSLTEGRIRASLEPVVREIGSTAPNENGEQGEENGAVDVHRSVFDSSIALAPLVDHDAHAEEVEDGPHSGKGHVRDDKVFARLDGGHLLKEPFSDEQRDRSDEGDDADESGEIAGGR